ncbi:MAG: aminotransferase class IV [Planctomycetota bacterium]
MPHTTAREQLLFYGDSAGAHVHAFPAAFGTASRALDVVSPGVYEGLRTFERTRFFGLRTHLARLRESAARFKTELLYDEEALVRAVDIAAREATEAFQSEARLRLDVAADTAAALGIDSNILIAASAYHGVPEHIRREGATVRTAPGLRRPDPGVKTSDFIPLREAWVCAHGDPDAYEHVMLSEDRMILEGTQSNLVLVRDGELYHAPRGVLPGVTVRAVIDLARAAGVAVHDRFVAVEELSSFDEAFLTTSVRSVVPVRRIDGCSFEVIGPVTRRLSSLYDELTASDAVEASDRESARY